MNSLIGFCADDFCCWQCVFNLFCILNCGWWRLCGSSALIVLGLFCVVAVLLLFVWRICVLKSSVRTLYNFMFVSFCVLAIGSFPCSHSTNPSGGNQVDGFPPAVHNKIRRKMLPM